MKITYVKQTDLRDCGVSCLISMMKYYGGYATREYLRELTNTTKEGVSVYSLQKASQELGFESKAVSSSIKELKDNVPFIAHIIKEKKFGHFVVVTCISDQNVTIMDPENGIYKMTHEEWSKVTTNVYLLLKPKTAILKQSREKSFLELIFPIIKNFQRTIVILFIFSLIFSILNIFISYHFEFFLNMIERGSRKGLYLIFFIFLFFIFIRELTNLFRSHLINYLNHLLDKSLINEVYHHIIRLPYLYLKNRMTGDLLTRIQDIFTIREAISQLLIAVLLDLVLSVSVFIILVKINLKLALVLLLVSILYFIGIIIFNLFLSKKIKEGKEKETKVNHHIVETLNSINTIKSMQIEDSLENKLEYLYEDYQMTSFHLFKTLSYERFYQDLIYHMGIMLVLFLGILEVFDGKLSLSRLLVFNSMIIYYFTPIKNLANLHMTLKDASISFQRIKELLNVSIENLVPDRRKINHHLRGKIEILNLRYSYNQYDDILKCQKLMIKESEKVLLYGTSGSGKSTLMKILCSYLTKYKGTILLDNKNLYNYHLFDLRNKITYVSQDETLYTDTIYNNIVLDNKIDYDKYLKIIKLTGVDQIIERSLVKHDMMIMENGSNLSGGERQKVILARALVKNSDIYIFDESLSAIDIKNERIILKNIFNYLKNKTVIVISHRFNNRDLYQKFILIEKGVLYEY